MNCLRSDLSILFSTSLLLYFAQVGWETNYGREKSFPTVCVESVYHSTIANTTTSIDNENRQIFLTEELLNHKEYLCTGKSLLQMLKNVH